MRGPSDLALFSSMPIHLLCVFEGIPAPQINWTYFPPDRDVAIAIDGGVEKYRTTSIVSGGRDAIYYTVNSSLEFQSGSVADAGAYTCSADNGIVNLIGALSNATAQLYFEENGERLVPLRSS